MEEQLARLIVHHRSDATEETEGTLLVLRARLHWMLLSSTNPKQVQHLNHGQTRVGWHNGEPPQATNAHL